MNRRAVLGLAAAGALVAAGGLATRHAFAKELARARARIAGRSAIAASRFGAVEYAVAGDGPPVLAIHGSGGGFDHGLALAAPLLEAGYRIVAPSRFGYLRSAFPGDPSPESQADAFADLLDGLGIDRLAVLGGSAGAPSALQLALRHPRRCAALALVVPIGYAPDRTPAPPPSPIATAIIDRALASDFLFWLGVTLAPRAMIGAILATDPALVDTASPEERARVKRLLRDILPVSMRATGIRHDTLASGRPRPMPLERIACPTLAISLEDDRYGTLPAARHIAAQVPGARLVSYPTGGHVGVGRNAAIYAELDAFLKAG